MAVSHHKTLTLADAVEVLNAQQHRQCHWMIDYAGGGQGSQWALGVALDRAEEDLTLTEFEAIAIAEKLMEA